MMWYFLNFVYDFPPLEEIVGGEQVRPYEILTNMARLGHQVTVYTIRQRPARVLEGGHLQVRPLSLPANRYWHTATLALRVLATLRAELHAGLPQGPMCLYQMVPGMINWLHRLPIPVPSVPVLAMFALARRMGATTWGMLHDPAPDQEAHALHLPLPDGVSRKRWRFRLRLGGTLRSLDQRAVVQLATLVTPAGYCFEDLLRQRYGATRATLTPCPPACNPALAAGLDVPVSPRGRPLRWGYVGSLYDASLPLLVEAVRRLNGGGLAAEAVVGLNRLSEAQRAALRRYHDGPVPVRVCEGVRYAGLASFARQVDAWVIPYAVSTAPYDDIRPELKLPLYLSTGRPVVRTATRELEHTPHLRRFVHVAGPSPDDLAQAMAEVASNWDGAVEQAQRARDYVVSHLTWRESARNMLDILNAAVDQEGAKPWPRL